MRLALIWASFVLIIIRQADAGPNNGQPNIVFVLADDLGWNDVSYHGAEFETPNLDELAASGVKLENYYVQNVCSPTRGQLLTGVYQIRTGLQSMNLPERLACALPLQFPTIADELKKLGYATHIVGKWHLGFYKEEYMPHHRGFDSFYGFLSAYEDYYTHRDTNCGDDCPLDFRHNDQPVRDKDGQYSTHVFTERAENLIEAHAQENPNKPLFLYLPYQAVHAPVEAPQQYIDGLGYIKDERRRIHGGMVSALDEAVGKVKVALEKNGLWENTLLIFSTDNGGHEDYGGNNWPLRGHKAGLWEGGIRAVGFATGPFLSREGATSHELMHVSDWFPTLIQVAGGDTSSMALDGHNVWQSISKGQKSPRRELLHNIDSLSEPKGSRKPGSPFDNRLKAAIRLDNWKLLTGDPGEDFWIPPPNRPQLNETFEIDDDADKNIWLFDLDEDPEERNDLAEGRPDIVNELLGKLAEYSESAVPALSREDCEHIGYTLHYDDVRGPWLD